MSKVGSNTPIPTALATLVQSAICRTKVGHRPCPSLFYFPGLNTQPVWKPDQFSFTKQLEASYTDILTEYQQLRSMKMKSDYGSDEQKLHSGQWDWHSYVSKGKRQSDFAIHCPKTVDLLESLQSPRLMIGTPFSFAFFSTMHAHSSIKPHSSPCNLRVRCHFPLILPKQSNDFGMRIANHTVQWETGKALYFDDSYEHEGKFIFLFYFFLVVFLRRLN